MNDFLGEKMSSISKDILHDEFELFGEEIDEDFFYRCMHLYFSYVRFGIYWQSINVMLSMLFSFQTYSNNYTFVCSVEHMYGHMVRMSVS